MSTVPDVPVMTSHGHQFLSKKDGMWAVMAWLQILAKKTEAAGKLVSVEDPMDPMGGSFNGVVNPM